VRSVAEEGQIVVLAEENVEDRRRELIRTMKA
jgi:hypothetical protein